MPPTIVEPKPGIEMGRIVVRVAVENVNDRAQAERGEGLPAGIRRLEIEALVNTGATFFCMPESLCRQLGLEFDRAKESRTITGPITLNVYRGAKIEVQGRACNVEVLALPEGRQCLLGQLPLETLDWWVDTTNRCLVGNPEHGGQWMAEVF